jgi:hypothetical protein
MDAPTAGKTDPAGTYSVNFAVVSRHAEAMSLVLARYNPAEPDKRLGKVLEIALDPEHMRSGDVWHVLLHNLRDLETLCYAWRADGDSLWQGTSRFSPGTLPFENSLIAPCLFHPPPISLWQAASRLSPGPSPLKTLLSLLFSSHPHPSLCGRPRLNCLPVPSPLEHTVVALFLFTHLGFLHANLTLKASPRVSPCDALRQLPTGTLI